MPNLIMRNAPEKTLRAEAHALLPKLVEGKIPFLRDRAISRLYDVLMGFSDKDMVGSLTSMRTNDNGFALSPAHASLCLVDKQRTHLFSKGVYEAIHSKIKKLNGKRKVRVLYAGSGPFATLALASMKAFPPNEVSFNILDINEFSLNNTEQVFDILGFENHIERFTHADAALYEPSETYDIIISETMNAGLNNEPLIPIYHNLKKYLEPDGDFIPEDVALGLAFERSGFFSRFQTPPLRRLTDEATDPCLISLQYTPSRDLYDCSYVSISTTVEVYGELCLKPNKSIITRDQLVGLLDPYIRAGKTISVSYDSRKPLQFAHRIDQPPKIIFNQSGDKNAVYDTDFY